MTKKPYFGLKPGTHEWMEVWKAHPELQEEMLEYGKLLTKKDQAGALKIEVEVTEENLEDQIENLLTDIENMIKEEEELEEEPSEAPETEEESPVKTKAQKKRKKSKARVQEDEAHEKELPEVSGNIITVKDLADEFGVAPKTLRKWLRNNFAKPGGRWEWPEGSSDIEDIREAWKEQNGKSE